MHVAGYVADMDQLNAIAQKYKLAVLETPLILGAVARQHGTLGDCGTFSFRQKNITCGEGGVMVTNDEALADLCHSIPTGRAGRSLVRPRLSRQQSSDDRVPGGDPLGATGQTESARQTPTRHHLDRALRGRRAFDCRPTSNDPSQLSHKFSADEPTLRISRDRFLDALAEGVPASRAGINHSTITAVQKNQPAGITNLVRRGGLFGG